MNHRVSRGLEDRRSAPAVMTSPTPMIFWWRTGFHHGNCGWTQGSSGNLLIISGAEITSLTPDSCAALIGTELYSGETRSTAYYLQNVEFRAPNTPAASTFAVEDSLP